MAVSEAQKRANKKYRNEKMKQLVVRFSPHEMELYDWLKRQDNISGYLKGLVKMDKAARHYSFESANKGIIEIEISGDYTDGRHDVIAYADGETALWTEADGGTADEIMQWLVSQGVEFESDRSMCFNHAYIASVMLDGDETEQRLLDKAASWTEEQIAAKKELMLL